MTSYRTGARAALPLILPTAAIGISFGVLARPLMGGVAPIVMSMIVFSGAAQFAALTVLTAGGGVVAAIAAGMLMNARWLPMGFAVGPFLARPRLTRVLQAQGIVDASFAMASRGDGTYDRGVMIGATLVQWPSWVGGTVLGVLFGSALGDPKALGLDAMFVAFYVALLFEEAHGREAIAASGLGALIALVLLPFTPAGIPVVAASGAALIGLRRARVAA
jgi:4-azaleucine resistance transporter AzlC